jgi:nucleotide-binding universal stress UspA family protein
VGGVVRRDRRPHAEELVNTARDSLREQDAGTIVNADAMAGTPGTVLADVARSASLLVVGRRGVGAFTRLLIGSTSENAVNHADGPVVVVPNRWEPHKHAYGPVIAGVDSANPSSAALEFAYTTAAERSVPLCLVHFWDLPAGYVWDALYSMEELKAWRQRCQAMFNDIVDTWSSKYPEVVVEPGIWQRHPVEGIVDEAADVDAQLIVVGGRRHNRLTGFVLGSVARGVLHHATRPLAVVHDATRA